MYCWQNEWDGMCVMEVSLCVVDSGIWGVTRGLKPVEIGDLSS